MKKTFSLLGIFLFVLTITSYSQQDTTHSKQKLTPQQLQQRQQLFEKKADSAISNRTIVRMKELFTLTSQQEQALFQAGLTISDSRRGVFKSYWKTDAFRVHMVSVDSTADVLYASIVGANNYQAYKDTLHSRLILKQQNMRQRATDTTHIKH